MLATALQIPIAVALALMARQEAGDFRISTDVERVVLPVTVRDRRGEFVTGLEKDNFRVYEEGRLQEIRYFSNRDIPVTVGLVVDSSASMRPKRTAAILAALHFVRLSNPRDEVFVVNFNERVWQGLREGTEFSADPNELREALTNLPADGKTALYDAVATALQHLSGGTCDKRALLVVSDGGDNASRHTFREVLEMARASDALIYTIGLVDPRDRESEENPGALKKLARETGGEAFFPGRPDQVGEICSHVARELRSQYTIGYAPDSRKPGYRRIQVVASAPGRARLNVRTRAGYRAAQVRQSAEGPK